MKTIYIYVIAALFLLSSSSVYSQSRSQNYIKSYNYTSEDGRSYLETIQYLDGLGRPEQVVEKGITPNGKDLVTLQTYDNMERADRSYLPVNVTTATGERRDPENIKTRTDHVYGKDSIYSRTVYENSPLNRPVIEYGPGKDWYVNNKGKKISYLTNSTTVTNLRCRNFSSSTEGSNIYMTSSDYASGTLFVTQYEDEDGSISYEFTNNLGQVILQRQVFSATQNYDTYYIYSTYGNLIYVIPPMAVDEIVSSYPSGTASLSISNALVKKYVYCYQYDYRNRCTKKRIPGCEWESYVYDKTDRLIFYQDARHSGTTTWFFTIPDAIGRTVLKGVCTAFAGSSITIGKYNSNVITAQYDGRTDNHGYKIMRDGTTVTLTANPVLEAYYYDNYDFISRFSSSNQSALKYVTGNADYSTRYGDNDNKTAAKGLLTGRSLYRLEQTAADNYIYTAFYYDYRGNLVQSMGTNTVSALEKEYMKYNFSGQLIKKQISHSSGNGPIGEVYEYTYDHAGRLTNIYHTLNSGTRTRIEARTYDEVGRLKTTAPLNNSTLKTTYAYNVRSWVTELKGTRFSQSIYYNEKYDSYAPSYYNGNISGVSWTIASVEQGYTFNYDKLSRLTGNSYYKNRSNTYAYRGSYTYDKHGNPLTVKRVPGTNSSNMPSDYIDNLTFTYNGNQILTIKDTGTKTLGSYDYDFKDYSGGSSSAKYEYDKAGYVTKDPYKGATFTFHVNGMPKKTTVAAVQGTIEYNYLADGTKTRVKYEYNPSLSLNPLQNTGNNSTTKTTVTYIYSGNKIYKNSTSTLDRILLPNGYIKNNVYYFYLRDYQGNVRVVANSSGTVIQENHYFPFGMPTADGKGHEEQPNKYSEKEYDTMLGMNMYDFHARQYDPPTIRFRSPDERAEDNYSWSPYAYCVNNPVKFVDLDGKQHSLPPVDPSSYRQAAVSKQVDKIIYENRATLAENTVAEVLSMTDVNDAAVIVTSITRGGDAVNIGGSPASGVDIGAAIAGALIPAVSGSAVKEIAKDAAKFLGVGSDAAKNTGRGKNHLKPNKEATGSHSSFRRDKDGNITHTATYEPNSKNPTGFDEVKQVHKTGSSHKNKAGQEVHTPHVHEKKDVRPAMQDEIPKSRR